MKYLLAISLFLVACGDEKQVLEEASFEEASDSLVEETQLLEIDEEIIQDLSEHYFYEFDPIYFGPDLGVG